MLGVARVEPVLFEQPTDAQTSNDSVKGQILEESVVIREVSGGAGSDGAAGLEYMNLQSGKAECDVH